MKRYRVRLARADDGPALHEVEVACWGADAAPLSTIETRLSRFHEGTVVVEDRRTIIAFGVTVRVRDYAFEAASPSWNDATGHGVFDDVLDVAGRVLYGVNLAARPNAEGAGAI